MEIVSIHIYGFGQFENKEFHLNPTQTLHVFFGNNEAGKSTIIAFVHTIFFGFPTRHQLENRYEPKTGAKFGGKVMVKDDDGQRLTIERVSGRTTGELVIFDESGQTYGNNQLKHLLKGFDRSLYQAIFSFGFKGLQEIEKIKSTELSHYLFSAGASGSQVLFELDKKINKKLDDLYKPSGRKPLLNEQLAELESLRNELNKWDGKIQYYNGLVDEQRSLKRKAKELDQEIHDIFVLIKEYEKKQMLQPSIQERKRWLSELSSIGHISNFPEDGISRLQQLQFALRPLIGQKNSLIQKITEVEKDIQSIHVREDYIDYEPKVRALKEQQKVYELQRVEQEKLSLSLTYEQTEISTLTEKLGHSYSEEKMEAIDTSISVKQKLKTMLTKQERLNEEKKFLDEQFQKVKSELEVAEASIKRLTQQRKQSLPLWQYLLLLIVISSGASLWFIYNSILAFIIAIVVAVGLFLNMSTKKNSYHRLIEKEQTIHAQRERLFEDILKQFESWEQNAKQVDDELSLFCLQNNIPDDLPASLLLHVFDWIEDLKKHIRTTNHLRKEMNRLETALQSFQNDVDELMEILSIKEGSSIVALHQMIDIIEQEKEKKQFVEQLKEKLKEYKDEQITINEQMEYLNQEITELFANADVKDENEFLIKANANKEYTTVKEKLQSIENQLQSVLLPGEERYLEELEKESFPYPQMIEKLNDDLVYYREELKKHQLRIADLTIEIKNVEEGTTYSELLHRYELKKAEFQQSAQQWAIYKVAKDIIDRTRDYYRRVRLPEVVEAAEGYFSFLTDGVYPRIFAPTEEKGFIVERQDGFRFDPSELSQATTEQLYLSLRLALINSFIATIKLPIIVDDSFVNFDFNRTKRVLELLKDFSREQQILFFTCHRHIIESFEDHQIIQL